MIQIVVGKAPQMPEATMIELRARENDEELQALRVDPVVSPASSRQRRLVHSVRATKRGMENFKDRIDSLPKPCRFCLCCCCLTFSGLRELCTSGSTIEFALGFIIGEQFSRVIYSVTSNLVSPIIMTFFQLRNVDLQALSGFFLLTNPNQANVTAIASAYENDCQVLAYQALFQDLISFLFVMITVHI